MKKISILILCVVLLVELLGCTAETQSNLTPASLYYQEANIIVDQQSSVTGCEFRDMPPFSQDIKASLNAYLKGPENKNLISPFPNNLTVVDVTTTDISIYIVLSEEASSLVGIDLTIACSCISQTIVSNTDFTRIHISAKDTKLDGARMISIYPDNVVYVDQIPAESDLSNPTES